MNAARARVRVELLLWCRDNGGAVESTALFISDNPVLLSILKRSIGGDDFMPMELHVELDAGLPGAGLCGYFNRAEGYRLGETLKASVGGQWEWPSPHDAEPDERANVGRIAIPVQRLWMSWEGGPPHPSGRRDLQRLAGNGPGYACDKVLVMPVSWPPLGMTRAWEEGELMRLVAARFA